MYEEPHCKIKKAKRQTVSRAITYIWRKSRNYVNVVFGWTLSLVVCTSTHVCFLLRSVVIRLSAYAANEGACINGAERLTGTCPRGKRMWKQEVCHSIVPRHTAVSLISLSSFRINHADIHLKTSFKWIFLMFFEVTLCWGTHHKLWLALRIEKNPS